MNSKALLKRIETALSYYDMMRDAQRKYNQKKKEAKIAAGEYKGRGRPRKIPTGPSGPSGGTPSCECGCASL